MDKSSIKRTDGVDNASYTMERDVVIIGAGLTGLTTALMLKQKGLSVALVEKSNRTGGQIATHCDAGFVFESGPNTGAGASEEVMKLFSLLEGRCNIEFAAKSAEKRWIWKNGRFHTLPSGIIGGITTPLFSPFDKLRILGEPFRSKGNNPDESVADLTIRRLGKSFLDYAVDPFISGIYAGNPHTLVTRHALPKLYNLEQRYGSFIGGSIRLARERKKLQVKRTKKGIFSAQGGMEQLTRALTSAIGEEAIFLEADQTTAAPEKGSGLWHTGFSQDGKYCTIRSRHLVTTTRPDQLPHLLPFISKEDLSKITNLRYAPVVQIAVGLKQLEQHPFRAFGGLIPSKEQEDFLGILFPSSCFTGRCPERGMLFSFFMGGIRNSRCVDMSASEIEERVVKTLHRLPGIPKGKEPDIMHIFRHRQAIPQYEQSSSQRFETVLALEKQFAGLHIAGNLRNGIGMSHRITQGFTLSEEIE